MEPQEHWKLDGEGNFEGLFTIGIEPGQYEDIWDRLDVIIGAYTKLHPKEIEECVRENAYETTATLTPHGEGHSKNLGLRHRMRIPAGLLRTIEQYTPIVFENSEMYQKFLAHYPGFKVFERL